jgi:dCMP deaminase
MKWHKFYMNMAKEFAKMSQDPRLKVGAVIVTVEGILYPGFNGWEKGGTNEPDSLEPGQSGTVHAECNACIKFNPTIHKNCKMYLTDSPCAVCARMIVNTQAISEVYYEREYRITKGVEILKERGILCRKL